MNSGSYWHKLTRERLSRRRAITGAAGLGAAALALSLVGCGGDDDSPGGSGTGSTGSSAGSTGGSTAGSTGASGLLSTPTDSTAQAKRGGTLLDYQVDDVLHFDAIENGGASAVVNFSSVYAYPRLLRFVTPKYPELADGSTEGEVAQSYEEAPDGLQVTLKLRPGMKWDARAPTSGRTIDAEDVTFSWAKFVELHSNANDLKAVESVTAPDDETIVMKLSEYEPSLINLLADWARFYVMPRESDGGFDPKAEVRGHGPYLLEEYVPSGRVVWTRNPDYWMPERPFFERIERPIITEYAARLAQFRAGSIYTTVVNSTDLVQTKNDLPATTMYQDLLFPTGLAAGLISFGYEGDSPFKDVRVRQAVSLSIDRETFNRVAHNLQNLNDDGIDVDLAYNTAVSPGFQNYWLDPLDAGTFGESAKYFGFNLAEAKTLLEAAGHGSGLEFDFYTNSDGNWGSIYSTARDILDGMFRTAGFTVNQQLIPYPQILNDYRRSYADEESPGFNGLGMWTSSNVGTIEQFLRRAHYPGSNQFCGSTLDGNNAGAGDPESNAMIDTIHQERDPERKKSLVHDFIRYQAQHVYIIPRPAQVKEIALTWPVIGNMNVYSRPLNGNLQTEEALHWWYDATKPPAA
jgi:ABC-type transport system substrate-binding protein